MESSNTKEATGTINELQILYECELKHGRNKQFYLGGKLLSSAL